jgi:hypothetical protein
VLKWCGRDPHDPLTRCSNCIEGLQYLPEVVPLRVAPVDDSPMERIWVKEPNLCLIFVSLEKLGCLGPGYI